MYNDRSISSPLNHHQRGSSSGSILDWRNIKFSKIYGSSSPVGSGSIERLNASSLNRGKDGIFRPKTLFQSATQIDFDSLANSRARILPSRGMTPIQANPRLAHLHHNYHRHHAREPSLTRTSSDCAAVTRYSSSPTSNSGRSTPTRSTDFYSNFNDNLSYLNHSHSRPGSLSSSNYSTNLALSTTTSPYIPGKYKFTTAYYAPKYRERPLLSNLNLKFGAKGSGISNTSSSLVRTGVSTGTGSNKGSINSSSPSSSIQRNTNSSSVNSSHNSSVSSNESSSVKQKPALERNKFLIKFREHEPLNHQSLERRRSSISWDIPNDYQRLDFANKTATECIQEEEPNAELDALPDKVNDTHNGAVNSQDNKIDSNGLTRWKGSFDLSEDELTKNKEATSNATATTTPTTIKDEKHLEPMMLKENIIVNGDDNCIVLHNQQNELKLLKLPKFSADIKANKCNIEKKKKQIKPLDKDKEKKSDVSPMKKTKSLKLSTVSTTSNDISPSKTIMTNAFIPCLHLTAELNLGDICSPTVKTPALNKDQPDPTETSKPKKNDKKNNEKQMAKEIKKSATFGQLLLSTETALPEQHLMVEPATKKVKKKSADGNEKDKKESDKQQKKLEKSPKDKVELTIIKGESKVVEEEINQQIGAKCSPKSPNKSKKPIVLENLNDLDIKQDKSMCNKENLSSLTPKLTNADKTSPKSPKKTKFSFKELPQDVKGKTPESISSGVLIKKSKTQELSKQLKILTPEINVDKKLPKEESTLEKVTSPKTPKTPNEQPLSPKLLNTSKEQSTTLIETDNATKKKAKKSKSPNIESLSPKILNAEPGKDNKNMEVNLKKSKSPKVEPKQTIVPVKDDQTKSKLKEKSNNKSMELESNQTKLIDAKLATKQEKMAAQPDPVNNNANESIGVKVLNKTRSKKQKVNATASTAAEETVSMLTKKVTSPKLVNENESSASKLKTKSENDVSAKIELNLTGNIVNIVKENEQTVTVDIQGKQLIKISQNSLDPFQRRNPHQKKIRFREYGIDDFKFLTVLGRGSFGKVMLAELINHECHFAIKCLKKQTVIDDDDVESIMIERKVLAYGTSHPFICKLFCTFQTECHLFFVMELCSGGDLMFHVQKESKFSESKSRFYAAEILCAIWFLHKRGIIYRDLKLDNVMIANDGHIRLVDFGMCVGKMYREEFLPSNFCGTPEYMAPEIIKGVKYNHSVDYWALGVVIYEMCVGTSPFQGADEDELLWNVCNTEVHYPKFLTEQMKNLCVLLMKKNPAERLGLPTSPHGDIVTQPWFHGVQWDLVEKCKVKPPFIPQLEHDTDVSYFDQYFTKETPGITPCDKQVNENDQILFQGFNYTNHRMTD